jgi:parvulin-like peptidyl-prolyl isomerase
MNRKLTIFGFLLLGFAAAGAQVPSHAPTVFSNAPAATPASGASTVALTAAGKPVVRVNSSVLTDVDLVREEYSIFPYARQHNGLPKDLAPHIRDGAMKMLVFEELVYQEALRRNMVVSAAKMQHAEADFRRQFASPEEFNALMQSEFHGSRSLLQEKIRRSLLIEAFLKAEVENKSAITQAEARAYYDKNPVRFQHPESFTFQTISVLPPPNATAAQLKEGPARAEKALSQAKTTKTAEEFGLLAEKISDDDYRVMMGQHKPMAVNELAPQVAKALVAMKVGDVSNVIQVEQAYTIVRLGEHTSAGKAKFEDIQTPLTKELQQKKENDLRAALDKKLRQNAKIQEL